MFLEYGIGKSLQSSIIPILRPNVILHEINSFSDILNGYEKSFFGNVVISAGARKVILNRYNHSRASYRFLINLCPSQNNL